MKKNRYLKLMPVVLFLLLQGCYVASGTRYAGYSRIYDPPPIAIRGYPSLIVIPDTTYVYAVPDIAVDLFFWNGYWWRPWEGRWYRSQYYNRSWNYYSGIPGFYYDVDPRWKDYYRGRQWQGHRWNYERISSPHLQRNWKKWQNDRYWEKRGNWGVQNYQPKPSHQIQKLREQRQQQIQQRQPQIRQPQQPPRVQPQPNRPQVQPQRTRPEQRQPQIRQPQQSPRVQSQPNRPQVQPRRVQPGQQRQPQIKQRQQPPETGEQRGRNEHGQ
ncbi:MAG: hypothetical protein GX751_03015 [Desulfuromonadaceae bacterium]|nr:hypothetical protein [Desulfuromonadaceae bacterium]